ncbi:Activator of Hsp90 ATPase 1 family protein [Methylocella tundrae]|uniref:Activator of Hsp90 ATPase 1 family protein n=1 Tax=Methylocella tundrae TaxID=227605 RepID=A0A8B6MCA3_METTU|nr:SRPBCC domain-containing protein [Methylocella tundrae]VTZ28029.1 Activator of Hsp90 ATPase 1 family protein [Methylocella tundrae]VTZ52630.1 Activator of Hsp90 ATPase 1 family protein [Methylocella tundrae]
MPLSSETAASADALEPFVISRSFDAPRPLLWQALTDPERLAKWWGPKGYSVIAAKMDFRPGGSYLYGLRTPDGGAMWGRFIYQEIEKPARIVVVTSFSDEKGGLSRHPMSPTWPLETRSIFSLEDEGQRTKLTVSWLPINATDAERATFAGAKDSMQKGWDGTLDQLADYLAGL